MSVADVISLQKRPATPAVSARQATPVADIHSQYRDVLYSAQDIPFHHQASYVNHTDSNQPYEPALKAWVNSANDYGEL